MREDNKKEWVCRACLKFLNSEELVDGECPNCETDENIFLNDLNE